MSFWHGEIVERSWRTLQELKRRYDFTLIGGWAIYLYTRALKSKDIDIIVDFPILEKLKLELGLKKNWRLRKYETLINEVEVDVYVPYFSNLGVPVEEIQRNLRIIEGFKVPKPEVLLILKQVAEAERSGSIKGRKDRLDILALILNVELDWGNYTSLVSSYGLVEYARRLYKLVESTDDELKILGMRDLRKIKKLKRSILERLREALAGSP